MSPPLSLPRRSFSNSPSTKQITSRQDPASDISVKTQVPSSKISSRRNAPNLVMAATSMIGARRSASVLGPQFQTLVTASTVFGASLAVVHSLVLESKGQPIVRFLQPSYVELRIPRQVTITTDDVVRAVEDRPYMMTGAVGVPIGSAVASIQLSKSAIPLVERISRASAYGQIAVISVALVAMIIRDRAMQRQKFEKERAKWSAN